MSKRAVTLLVLAVTAGCGTSDYDPANSGGTAGVGGFGGGDCGGAGGTGGSGDAATLDDAPIDGGTGPDGAVPPGDGGCQTTVAQQPAEGAQHVPICSPVTYGSNPPSSGNHYPVWAEYKTYDHTIPRGFWVHSLEHGAMVITYNCPGGCPAEVAEAQAFIDGLPADCGAGPSPRRLILVPDPELDVRFAASAWGFTLRSYCFDRDAFTTFYNEHYNRAPEAICGGGSDPTGICGDPICP